MTEFKSFPAKLLLFGEYTVLSGGDALSIPFHKYSGSWNKEIADDRLTDFYNYLRTLDFLNTESIRSISTTPMSFQSSIPTGYGMGSSGALTAASYDIFRKDDISDLDILKQRLSEMEGFFHGNSSGFDPLTSYLNKAILLKEGKIHTIGIPALSNSFFIYDSMQKRQSGKMIQIFNNLMVDDSFKKAVAKLKDLNAMAIDALLLNDRESLFTAFQEISIIQWNYFNEMITEELKSFWKAGLESGNYYLKLNGAGGGGCYLGIGDTFNTDRTSFID